jgi:hypothetical protein
MEIPLPQEDSIQEKEGMSGGLTRRGSTAEHHEKSDPKIVKLNSLNL